MVAPERTRKLSRCRVEKGVEGAADGNCERLGGRPAAHRLAGSLLVVNALSDARLLTIVFFLFDLHSLALVL